jgi:AcrR family transcriptional regulator
LNDRYFYEHFKDTDALLEALAREFGEAGLTTVVAATRASGPSVHAKVHAGAAAVVDFFTADPRRPSLLIASYTSDVVQRTRVASTHHVARVVSSMSQKSPGDAVPSPADADLAAFTLVSGTLELVAAWLRGEFPTSREHLVDVIAAMLLAAGDLSATLAHDFERT